MRRLALSLAVSALAVVAVLASRPAAATSATPAKEACVKTFQRQRTCTDAFIPALVDARVSVNKPKGIAEEAAKPGGRDALIKQALEEWKTDSTDTAIDATCTRIASSPRGPAVSAMAAQCAAAADCAAFVQCVVPLMKPSL